MEALICSAAPQNEQGDIMFIFRVEKFLLLICVALLLPVTAQQVEAGPYRCENGQAVSNASQCQGRGGLAHSNTVCGNNYIELGEVCDNGAQNTDIEPNGCRTDCRQNYCGDSVVDSGEQCDRDYLQNAMCFDFDKNGHIQSSTAEPYYWGGSLSCKSNCSYDLSACHYCGDGVTQSPQEQCDDGNSADDDGCNVDCTACLSMQNINLESVSSDTQICTQDYNADDYGDLGAIIIKAPNVVLDCDFARLTGTGDGIGIYIKRSDNVTVKNCIIDNYEFGIYAEDSDNIQVLGMGNKMYNTSEQLVLDNSTAQPAPPLDIQQFDAGLSPNQQALMGQKLQTRRVPSRVGDSLKLKAKPGLLVKPSGSSSTQTAVPARESREARRARLRAERKARSEKREAEGKSRRMSSADAGRDARAVAQPRIAPKPLVRPALIAVPVITYPKSGQRFTAPARVSAKARFDKGRKVVYLLKQGKRVLKKSTRGSFSKLAAGDYCVAAAYMDKDGREGACSAFTVVNPSLKMTPLRPLPLSRP